VRQALRRSAARIKKQLVPAMPVLTGALRDAVSRSNAKVLTGKKFSVGAVVPLPPRSELGISLDDKGYYPAVLEYGAPADGIRERRMYRDTTDRMAATELPAITGDIRKGIEKEWATNNRELRGALSELGMGPSGGELTA
jgi:hypothetical protein